MFDKFIAIEVRNPLGVDVFLVLKSYVKYTVTPGFCTIDVIYILNLKYFLEREIAIV